MQWLGKSKYSMFLISLKFQSLYNLINVFTKKNYNENPCLNGFNNFIKFDGCNKMTVWHS
jgi:hypothetical protein